MSGNLWRQLKQAASNISPPFQWVLPAELQLQTQARAADGRPVSSQKKSKRKAGRETVASHPRAFSQPSAPSPAQVQVPCGVFECDGHLLSQVPLKKVGPSSSRVVLVSLDEAAPYLQIQRPVSSKPLALLVKGEIATCQASVQHERVRFQAECQASKDPILLSATILQIGDGLVTKRTFRDRTILEVAPSAVLRVSVFCEAWTQSWDLFLRSPIKAVIEAVEQLQVCSDLGCTCSRWHPSGAEEQDPLLEVWGRSFTSLQFRALPPAESLMFSAFLRVPSELEEKLLKVSGFQGVFFEPRSSETKRPSSAFSVVWLPRASLQEAILARQSHPEVLGLARVGERFGIRCSSVDVRSYQAGPFPYGTRCYFKGLRSCRLAAAALAWWRGRWVMVGASRQRPSSPARPPHSARGNPHFRKEGRHRTNPLLPSSCGP